MLAISTDSVFTHKVFRETSPLLKDVSYPMLSDRTQEISRAYRVLDEASGAAFRASIVINPEQIIEAKLVYPKEVGRNLDEHLRLIQALQFGRKTGQAVPANWTPGKPGIKRHVKEIGRN